MGMGMFLLGATALIAAPAAAEEWQPQPDLDWLAGYWLSCEKGRQVSETWSIRVGGILLGQSITIGKNAFSWEQMRIESVGGEATDLVFHAQPRGQAAADFRLVRADKQEAVFENKTHDFPQRVIYRREGDRLTGRIEGMSEGKLQGMEWHYQAAPLNSQCAKK